MGSEKSNFESKGREGQVESEKWDFESEDEVWEVENGRSDFESEGRGTASPQDLKKRTQAFALRVIRMVQVLPRERVADVIGKQVLRSATSVGANYRSACRGRSKPDFISKLGIAEEEADETCYWLELLIQSGIVTEAKLGALLKEAQELTAILTAAGRTAKARRNEKK